MNRSFLKMEHFPQERPGLEMPSRNELHATHTQNRLSFNPLIVRSYIHTITQQSYTAHVYSIHKWYIVKIPT